MEVIEAATGRVVIGFMSGNQQHPDLMCEVFILGPTDLVDEHEIPAPRQACPAADPGADLRAASAPRLALCCPAEGITAVGPVGTGNRS